MTSYADDFSRMHAELYDPEKREERLNLASRKKRREERMTDTGAYVV